MNRISDIEIVNRLGLAVRDAGGRAFFVGGFVRDGLLGRDNKDIDIEVHGLEADALYSILEGIGVPLSFGKSFGVYSLAGTNIDIALPRRESAVGCGHRDFEIECCPNIGTLEAARRRDFTINALMQDVLSGEIIDHFGGQSDLEKGVIRHVDVDHFAEDPLRVLRAARFAAVLGFEICETTAEICRGVDISSLSRERVEQELKRALLKSGKPSIFFESMRAMNQLDFWFPELKSLIGLEQNPKFHPEGDVWVHTMESIDRAATYRTEVSDAYSFMLLVLTHDLGKLLTQEIIDGDIHFYNHEHRLEVAEVLLKRLVGEKAVIRYVLQMIPRHMKPNTTADVGASMKTTNRMYDEAVCADDLMYMAMSDSRRCNREFLESRLQSFKELMEKPYVRGEDLIEAGLEPDRLFSEILAHAHKLRLAGVEKESALKQTLGFARQLYRKNRNN